MTSRVRSDSRKVRVAVTGLVALAVVMAIALNLQHLPLVGDTTTYHAQFSDASGLQAGNEVRVAGIKVGEVRSVDLAGDKVDVGFTATGVTLGARTTASIEIKSLLGEHYLAVAPAGAGSLSAGGTIPLSRTTTPFNLVPAFQQLTTTVQSLDTNEIAQAFSTMANTLGTVSPDVAGTLAGLSRLSESIASRDAQIKELFNRASQVSGTVAARDQDLASLMQNAAQVLDVLDQRRTTIDQIINGTVSLSQELSSLVRDNQAVLSKTIEKLNTVLQILRSNEQNIEQTITYGSAYLREFANVGGSGRWFDSVVKLPRNLTLCVTQSSNPTLGALLRNVLSGINHAQTGSSQPCLPVGAAGGAQ